VTAEASVKICPFCAEEIQDSATACKHCGSELTTTEASQLAAQGTVAVSSGQPRKGLAIASLALGLLNIPTLGLYGFGAIGGLVLGIIAVFRADNRPEEYGGKGMAIAGIVLSVFSIVLIPILGFFGAWPRRG
jgi:hypothetical protein